MHSQLYSENKFILSKNIMFILHITSAVIFHEQISCSLQGIWLCTYVSITGKCICRNCLKYILYSYLYELNLLGIILGASFQQRGVFFTVTLNGSFHLHNVALSLSVLMILWFYVLYRVDFQTLNRTVMP